MSFVLLKVSQDHFWSFFDILTHPHTSVIIRNTSIVKSNFQYPVLVGNRCKLQVNFITIYFAIVITPPWFEWTLVRYHVTRLFTRVNWVKGLALLYFRWETRLIRVIRVHPGKSATALFIDQHRVPSQYRILQTTINNWTYLEKWAGEAENANT